MDKMVVFVYYAPMSQLPSSFAREIWDAKYRLKEADGTPVDHEPADTFRRVAAALASVEKKDARQKWADRFFDLMADLRFLPAGRVLAGAGTKRAVTLFNCFVMGEMEDSISGIFDELKHAALAMQQGGGIGQDFSTLRPRGADVVSVGADASGPVSFMHVWDAMCQTIKSAGNRRGAMMATLRCDHPDIESFIAAKREEGALTNFNLSVLVTDAFMAAIEADADWDLTFDAKVYKTLKARTLWDTIMEANYEAAEPGVIFIDRINRQNNLGYCETISATNPCGEQPLPPFGACLLGSLNLARFVSRPFEQGAALDREGLRKAVWTAVRMLDNVIDVSGFPLPQLEREAQKKRRIGLGVTGLADALAMCTVSYGSPEGVELAKAWMAEIERAAYRASAALAAERGAFPAYDKAGFASAPVMARLDDKTLGAIAENGLRNGLLTSIAPTGTISLVAGNVSSGIEPIFAAEYERAVLNSQGGRDTQLVRDYAVQLYRDKSGADAELPGYFVTAHELTPDQHLAMQAALQQHVDSAISKTINCPRDISFDDFKSIYQTAFASGLKGCTTYRPTPLRGAVLRTVESDSEADRDADGIVYMKQPLERSEQLPGFTYKLKWPETAHAIYITINDIEQDGRRRPFEVFINSKNMEHYAWTLALTRMISAVFRRGGDVSFVVEELKAVFDPRGGQWLDGQYVPSLLAAIGGVIEKHMLAIGFIKSPLSLPATEGATCPQCGQAEVVFQEGCARCTHCSYSKCG